MASTIKLKNGSGAPTTGDLVQGEPALDLTNKRLYTENASGVVIEVGTNPSTIDINAGTIDGTVIGGSTAAAITGTTITGTSFVSSGDMTFGDNDKAIFGAGGDLQIYHDTNSYIQDTGDGSLFLLTQGAEISLLGNTSSEYMGRFIQDGSVELYHNGLLKLATTATGIDVTGTVTADGLTVDGTITVNAATASLFLNETDTTDENTQLVQASGTFRIRTADDAGSNVAERLRIDHGTGDLSLYDDTGTTAKFFWDASTERLGLGTVNPSANLEIEGATVELDLDNTSGKRFRIASNTDSSLSIEDKTSSATRLRIDSSGNVGINETVPFGKLHISDTQTGRTAAGTVGNLLVLEDDENGMSILSADAGAGYILFGDTASASSGGISYNHSEDKFNFRTNDAWNRMILDSSGNLLVGKTSADNTTAGTRIHPAGYASFTIANDYPIIANRLSSDGNIAVFRKDGADVGSIGTISGDLAIYSTTAGHNGLRFGNGQLLPTNNAGTIVDDAVDLGDISFRFDDIYATNGTIQTSDRNEKQDIEVLSEAEQRVAVACKGLLRKFRWKSKVEEKGDDARIHFGIIAQDLQAAFEAEGLDAGRYAMFISSTWTDEETGEERSRMGVRYSELLAFIIAAI